MLENWVNRQTTPKGIGIDCVRISKLQALDGRLGGVLVQRTFTSKERELAERASDYWAFLAGRFAVKEAVFKALSGRAPIHFDLRTVETLCREDGCPVINWESLPGDVVQAADAKNLLVSITNEGDYAIALVQLA